MSITPPDPGFPQSLQDRIAAGSLNADKTIAISGVDYYLTLEFESGTNACAWELLNPSTDTTNVRYVVSGQASFDAMASGTVNANGSITVGATTHYIKPKRATGGSNQAVWTA